MSDEERRKLDAIYTALFEVPPGSPPGTRSFMARANTALIGAERASLATRAMLWLLPTLAGLGLAVQTIYGFFGREG